MEPIRDLRDPDHYHVGAHTFSLRGALMYGHTMRAWSDIEQACGVPSMTLWQWWERIRTKSWEEQFIEALADSNRAVQRRAREGLG